MKLIYFLLFFICVETNQIIGRECGLSKREAIWSRAPSKLDALGRPVGQNQMIGKIMGGQNAEPGNFPWQAALVSSKYYHIFCGGTIVSPTTVISAPHCLTDYRISEPEDLVVSAGHISSTFR